MHSAHQVKQHKHGIKTMKDTDIPKLIELVVREATRFCNIKPTDLEDSSTRNPAHVAARRVAVYTLSEKIGLKTKDVAEALNLKGQTAYKMTKYGAETYEKKGAEAEGFTNAVNQITEQVTAEFGPIVEIQAVLTGEAPTSSEPAPPKTRRTKGPRKKSPATAPVSEVNEEGSATLPLVIFALSRINGFTLADLSEAFEVPIPEIERSVGRIILSPSQNKELTSVRLGIARLHEKIAAGNVASSKKK